MKAQISRGGSRLQLLTIITKRSILDVGAVLDPLLNMRIQNKPRKLAHADLPIVTIVNNFVYSYIVHW